MRIVPAKRSTAIIAPNFSYINSGAHSNTAIYYIRGILSENRQTRHRTFTVYIARLIILANRYKQLKVNIATMLIGMRSSYIKVVRSESC
jgi:hypothetical protein